MLSSITDRLFQGLDDAVQGPVLKANLNMLKDAIELLEKENLSLKEENAQLKEKARRVDDLEKELALSNQFIDLGVIKIKLGQDGKRLPVCYCPQCGAILPDPLDPDRSKSMGEKMFGEIYCRGDCTYTTSVKTIISTLKAWDDNH